MIPANSHRQKFSFILIYEFALIMEQQILHQPFVERYILHKVWKIKVPTLQLEKICIFQWTLIDSPSQITIFEEGTQYFQVKLRRVHTSIVASTPPFSETLCPCPRKFFRIYSPMVPSLRKLSAVMIAGQLNSVLEENYYHSRVLGVLSDDEILLILPFLHYRWVTL